MQVRAKETDDRVLHLKHSGLIPIGNPIGPESVCTPHTNVGLTAGFISTPPTMHLLRTSVTTSTTDGSGATEVCTLGQVILTQLPRRGMFG